MILTFKKVIKTEQISPMTHSVVFLERPGTPYNLGISDIQSRSVQLQFLLGYDGKTSITLWKIQGLIDNNSTWVPVFEISDPDARTIVVPTLRPFTMYRLRLAAVNIVGPSNYSLPSRQFQTTQAPPNVPPDNVTVRAINSTALRISWAVSFLFFFFQF